MIGPEEYRNYSTSEVFALAENKDVEGLIGVLKHNNHKHVVKRAIFALGEIKDDKAVGPLVEVGLKSELITIRRASFRALGDIGSHEAVEPLIYAMLKEKDDTGKVDAVQALGKMKDSRAVKTLTVLMHDTGENTNVREETVEALGKMATKEAIIGLIAALDGELKEKVSEVLKEIGQPAVMPLIAALGGDKEPIIWETATILGEIRDKRAVKPLITLLLDPNKDEWRRGYYVAVALGRIGDTDALKPLIQLASRHTEEMLTGMSVKAMGDIGDNRAVEPLIAILEDEGTADCSHLRMETCHALGKIRDVRAIESLIRILRDTRNNIAAIRDAAASALVQFDDDRIELPLLQYYGGELDSMIAETSAEDMHLGKLQGISKLIARLIGKS